MTAQAWQERILTPFGMEIECDLATVLTGDQAQRLIDLFRQHKLLVFRNQHLGEDDQVRLMELFGPVLGSKGEYRELSADGNLGSGPLAWHSDLAFTEEPFEAISLHAVEVQDGKSWTAFANGITTLRDLEPELRAQLEGRDAVTVLSMIQTHRAVTYETPDFLPQQTRPLVIPHPHTGEPILYINEMQTARIEGLPRAESDALLTQLFDRLYAEDTVYRHHWNNGDVVVWDNIALQHARSDLTGCHPRRMQRIVCARKSFFELLPQFSLEDPRIAAWGAGEALNLA